MGLRQRECQIAKINNALCYSTTDLQERNLGHKESRDILPAEKPFEPLDSILCEQIEPLHTSQLIPGERLQME